MTTTARPGELRVGPLDPSHRARLAEIVRLTGAFSEEEVLVAVALFDEAFAGLGSRVSGLATPKPGTRDPNPGSLTPASTPPYRFLGAFTRDGELAGYACYGPTPATDRVWDLYWIAIDPAAQGTGGGTLLLTEVERRLTDDDARMLVVETSSRSDYAATRAFYARRGYLEAARMRDFYAPADDRIIYVKRFHRRPGSGAGVQAA